MMRGDRVVTLARLFLSRLGRQLGAVVVAVGVLATMDIARHGVHLMSLVAWGLGGAIMVPPMQAVLVVRDKMDGSLRFLASLPVAGAEHVAARTIVAVVLGFPAFVLGLIGLSAGAPAFSQAQDVAIALTGWIGLAAISVAFTAVQMRTKVGDGMRLAMFGFAAVVIAARVLSSASSSRQFATWRATVFTARGFALASLLVWVLIGAAAWWAARTIARISESYEGEGPATV